MCPQNTTLPAAYQCEGVGGGGPPTHSGQRPGLEYLLRCLVHPHDAFPGDSQESGDQLVASFQLLLHQEEGHSIRAQGATQLDVTELGIQLCEVVQLAVVRPNELLDSFELDILFWEEFVQIEKTWLVFRFVVVPVLDLALQSGKLHCFFSGARVSAINDGILGL